MTKKITFILPTKNEEKTIGSILDYLHVCRENGVFDIGEILIADDSSDNTRKIASSKGAKITPGGGLGLGEAMFRGLKNAAYTECDFIISLDSDGQTNLDEIQQMIKSIEEHEADLVLSSRFKEGSKILYKYPALNRLGIIILVKFLKYGSNQPLTDSHGGIRIMRPSVAKSLQMIGTHTYVQETIFDAAQRGFKIIEIQGDWKERNGESRVLASIPKYIAYTLPVIILRLGLHIKIGLPLIILIFILGVITLFTVNVTNGLLITGISLLGILFIYTLEYLQFLIKQKRSYE